MSDDKLGRLVTEGALTEDELDELGHLVWRSWWSNRTGKAAAAAIGHATSAETAARSGGERRANDDRTAIGSAERAATHGAGTAGDSRRARQEGPGRGEAFDPVAKKLRDASTRSLAEYYLDHARANGGKCKRGFVKGLVDQARSSAPRLGITRDDIMNEVKRMHKGRNDSCAFLVSPAETNNAAPPSSLDLLASAVSQISPVAPWEVEGRAEAQAEAERARLWAWRAAQSVQRAAARSEEERQAKNARERARYKARRAAQSKEEWEAENARKRVRRAALLEG